MENTSHFYQKGEHLYELFIQRTNNKKTYLVLDDDTLVKQRYAESAITPSKGFFYLVKQGGKIDISETIEESLKNEILEDWANTQR